MSSNEFCCACWLQSKSEERWKAGLSSWPHQKTEKFVKQNGSNTNHSPKESENEIVGKKKKKKKKKKRNEIIQTTAKLKLARILRRFLETCCHLDYSEKLIRN